MNQLLVIKIGGHIIDDATTLDRFLQELSKVQTPCILVHGGGKLATRISERLGIESKLIEGRRITDAATLEVVTMVYGGLVNKQLVASLQALGSPAMGLTGADGDLIRSKKREHAAIDYGFVGDVTQVNASGFDSILQQNQIPVVAPLTHDGRGQLLNTNADTMAQSIAVAMSKLYSITLVFGFEKEGVLRDLSDEGSVINQITKSEYDELKSNGVVHSGMIPKLDNAFEAISQGVQRVIIGKADCLSDLLNGTRGTTLKHE
ncbi:MAG: acetylglutamate kinase [Bacteroidota bacterium]